MKKLTIALLICTALTTPVYAATKLAPGMDIAAVVGDKAVSSYDVEARMKFILETTQISPKPDVLARMRPQVVRSLVDENLQMTEAKKHDVSVTDGEVAEAIATIEEERGMPSGAIFSQLDHAGVPRDTFINQTRAQITWRKLLHKVVRPDIHVSDEEVDLAQKRIQRPTKLKEVQIGVITMPVDKPSREDDIRRLGEKLVGEVRRGASFEEVGRQFGGAAGGHVSTFWVRPEQLDPAIGKALAGSKAGDITDPVRTEIGFTIVKVYDVHAVDENPEKDQEVALKEILLKLKPDASNKEADALVQIGEDVAKHPGTCEEKGIAGMENLQDFDISVDYQRTRLSQLPPAIKIIAENLKVGDISTPFASNEGIRLYMLCDKKEAGPMPLERDKVTNIVYQQKIELAAQKYMRNLRHETFIEIRDPEKK